MTNSLVDETLADIFGVTRPGLSGPLPDLATPKAFEALPKDALLKVLEAKANALLGMANASQIGDEREGLKFQAYAIRQAIGLLKAC
jgi:hypothetical protein